MEAREIHARCPSLGAPELERGQEGHHSRCLPLRAVWPSESTLSLGASSTECQFARCVAGRGTRGGRHRARQLKGKV